jgi:trehalose 6-phosphate synthase/phosphatase
MLYTPETRTRLVHDYRQADRRLLLLDYDGTLVTFFEKPEEARPGEELLHLLSRLAADTNNEVVLLSGRDRGTLEEWFGTVNMSLVAEHGAWLKEKDWEMIEPLTNDWKGQVRPILDLYTKETPGAFVEEKEFSLVWHYRKADPELSATRVREMIDGLREATADQSLQILQGNKVVEIKNLGIDKGRAALRWIKRERWGLILALGDDRTDEDMFRVLPESAYSLKVGLGRSAAKYNLETQAEVLPLLGSLISPAMS